MQTKGQRRKEGRKGQVSAWNFTDLVLRRLEDRLQRALFIMEARLIHCIRRMEGRVMATLEEVLAKGRTNQEKADVILGHFDDVDTKFADLNTTIAALREQLVGAGVPQETIDELDAGATAMSNVLDKMSGRQAAQGEPTA